MPTEARLPPQTASSMRRPDGRRPLVLVAVLVITAGLVAAVWLRREPPPAPPFPTDLGVLSPPSAQFVGTEDGYLLLGRCPTSVCEGWVGVTHDGGRTWHASVVPDFAFSLEDGIGARLVVLDTDHAIIEGEENFDPLASRAPGRRWYTSDGGRTWSGVELHVGGVVNAIPPGAYVSGIVSTDVAAGQLVLRLILHDGTTGVLGPPGSTPYGPARDGAVIAAPDGSHWAVVRGMGTTAVLVSRNRGRSWSMVPLPEGHPIEGRRYEFYAGDGVSVHLVDSIGFRVWRSPDAGATWESLTVPFSAGIPDGGLLGVSLPDGRLLLHQPFDALFVTTATGSSFERADPELAFGARGRVLVPSADGSPVVAGGDGSRRPLPFDCLGGRCSW
jgi:photosystem II stability/assembly factor-like uncharacterized protein